MDILTLAALALFVAAAVIDGRSRRHPEPAALGLALLGLAAHRRRPRRRRRLGAAGLDLAAAAAVFLAGAVAFRFRLLGGGDVKLLAAGALWLGAAALGPFLLATALAGGVLALGFLSSAARARPATRPACPTASPSPPAASSSRPARPGPDRSGGAGPRRTARRSPRVAVAHPGLVNRAVLDPELEALGQIEPRADLQPRAAGRQVEHDAVDHARSPRRNTILPRRSTCARVGCRCSTRHDLPTPPSLDALAQINSRKPLSNRKPINGKYLSRNASRAPLISVDAAARSIGSREVQQGCPAVLAAYALPSAALVAPVLATAAASRRSSSPSRWSRWSAPSASPSTPRSATC